jgi:hypothetical protein
VGQEILYCNKCGKKLLGDDFTRGRAHTFNNRQFCATCVPQSISSGAQAALKEPPRAVPPPSTQGRLKAAKPATARSLPAPAAPATSSTTLLLVGLAVIAVAVGILYVVRTSGTSDPAPEPVVVKPPPAPVPAAKPDPPKPAPPPAIPKEKIAKDLQELEAKIQPTIKNEQFSAVTDFLEEARKRFEAPEWTQGVAKLIKDTQDRSASLYGPLKDQSCNAQLRGGLDEVKQARARLVGWGRKDLLDDFDKAIAAIVPREPLPPGATVLAVYPNGDLSRHRLFGEQQNGALLAVTAFDGKTVGMESGKEIFKVPTEGEVRVTFSTNSSKPILIVFRAIGPDGKNHPYKAYHPGFEVGRPQVFKVSISKLKDWNESPIALGSVVDNLYFRQEDSSAVLTVHEWVVFKTKD